VTHRTRYTAPPVIADPDRRFRHLAPQLIGYPNVPTRTLETILDTFSAMGSGARDALGVLQSGPAGSSHVAVPGR